MTEELPLKPVVWVGSSRRDLRAFPDPVQDHMLCHLRCPARWQAPRRKGAKWFWRGRGLGSGQKFSRRHIPRRYTLRYAGTVYVLHAFQKKSKTGRETPRRDVELIEKRVREAEKIAEGGNA